MKKSRFLLFLLMSFFATSFAQKKQITVEEIYDGAFRTERMDVLRSMKNGKQYTILNLDSSSKTASIDKYDYKTLEKVETIVSSKDLKGVISNLTNLVRTKRSYYWPLKSNRFIGILD